MKALWALAVLIIPSLGDDSSKTCKSLGDASSKTCKKEYDTSMMLLQVNKQRGTSSGIFRERHGADFREEVEDDGSQLSVPGPPMTLQDALRQLGTSAPVFSLGQQNDNSRRSLREGLASIAVVYISGRTTFDDALQQAVLQYVPMGEIFKTKGKVPQNFVEALEHAFTRFPSASWYYVADDDSFVHLERLAKLASTYDASSKVFIGKSDCDGWKCREMVVHCRGRDMVAGDSAPGWACGGPGMLISRPLVEGMSRTQCTKYYGQDPAPVCCGDMALSCCAWDAWEGFQVTNTDFFSPGNFTNGMKPDQTMVAIHKLTPDVTRKLGQLYNSHLASL